MCKAEPSQRPTIRLARPPIHCKFVDGTFSSGEVARDHHESPSRNEIVRAQTWLRLHDPRSTPNLRATPSLFQRRLLKIRQEGRVLLQPHPPRVTLKQSHHRVAPMNLGTLTTFSDEKAGARDWKVQRTKKHIACFASPAHPKAVQASN